TVIRLFIPFDHNHHENAAFRVLNKTYEPSVPFSEWQSIVRSYTHKDHNVVEKLARNIFTENTIQVDDMSLQIVEFDTLEEEMGAIVHKDRKSTRLNSSHVSISYAVFCLKKKRQTQLT